MTYLHSRDIGVRWGVATMQLGKLRLGPAKVLDGGVEGSVSHFAAGCECDEVSEVAGYDFESKTYDLK